MAKQHLDDADIGSALEKMCRKGMTQCMNCYTLLYPSCGAR